jgi:hypothetical protein
MIPAVNGWHAAVAALLFLIPRFSAAAEDLPGAARELARKTAALSGARGPVAVSYRNLSSLPDSELAQVHREFENALPGAGEGPAPVEARLTLSENAAEYLLVEEVRKGEEAQVWIASWKRAGTAAATPGLALDRRLVWEQDEPILDVAFPGNGMLVLSSSKITLYSRQAGQWQPQPAVTLPTAKPWPRDLRGHLRVTGSRIQVLLPGMECTGVLEPGMTAECHASEAPWVLESGSALLVANFTPDRNYFDGRVVLQNGSRKTAGPFYSAAAVEDQGGTSWLLAMVDGRTEVFNPAFEGVATIPSWGSDIAGTSARCGSPVLASRPGEGSDSDALQAFSVANRAAVPVSAPVAFPGPVTALWPSAAGSALAVARDSATGKYGAYVVTVVCGP